MKAKYYFIIEKDITVEKYPWLKALSEQLKEKFSCLCFKNQ